MSFPWKSSRFWGLILIIFPIIGIILAIRYKLPYLASICLFYLLPGLVLDISQGFSQQIARHASFAFVVTLPFALIIDWIGTQSGAWYVPYTIFPSRFIGVLPYEDFLWMMAGVFLIVVLYDFRVHRRDGALFGRGVRRIAAFNTFILGVFLVLVCRYPADLIWRTPWTYAILGGLFVLAPAVVWLVRTPGALCKILPVVEYFFYCTLLFELAAAILKYWVFEGSYLIPPLMIFGLSSIPYEELFFVGIVGPVAAIAVYECCLSGL